MKIKRNSRFEINVVSSSPKRLKKGVARTIIGDKLSNPRLRYYDDRGGSPASKVSLYMRQDSKRIIKDKILNIIIERNLNFSKEEKTKIKSLYANMDYNQLLRYLESLENKNNLSRE